MILHWMSYKQQSLFKPLGSNKNPLNFSNNKDNLLKILITASNRLREGREGNSSVSYEVLITNCEKDFINMFIFNYLASNINLFIFNSLTLDINLSIFNFLMWRYCIPKNIYFASRTEWLFVDAHPYLLNLNSLQKMMACYLRDRNKFLSYRTLYTSML